MAAYLLVADLEGSPFAPDAARKAAVFGALRERSPGEVLEVSGPGVWCCHCGVDGRLQSDDRGLLVLDGRPTRLKAASGEGGSAAGAFSLDAWRGRGAGLLPELDGGFSFAAFDKATRELLLARDRFGARPLFWAQQGRRVFVASEVKVLAAAGVELRISREALEETLACRWLVRDRSLFSPVRQVPAASCLVFRPGAEPVSRRYWQLEFRPGPEGPEALHRYTDEARTAMRSAIVQATGDRRVVGVLLSGGVDSSVIAAVAREVDGKVVAFAGRLPDAPNPELDRALIVARHLGIDCRVVDIEVPDFGDDLRSLVRRMEEPPRHPNNFLLRQLFQRAAQEVDLVLQGDAAEMLFGLADERRVARFADKHRWVSRLPARQRTAMARAVGRFRGSWATRVSRVLAWDPLMYAAMLDGVGYTTDVQRTLHPVAVETVPGFMPVEYFSEYADPSDALQAYQLYTFAAVSLVRHDRLAQPLGLTSESPFLRAPVVELACRLPRALRYGDGSKPVLRALCDLYLPSEVSRWPKLGFPVPWQDWMRRAVPGGVAPTEFLRAVLPAGFLEAARASGDDEAMWTALTLELAAEELGVDRMKLQEKDAPSLR